MKTSPDPADLLLKVLAEESADLPMKAAIEARQARAQRSMRRRQIAITATVLLCAACIRQFFPGEEIGPESVAIQAPAEAPIAFPEPSAPPLPHFPEPPEPSSPQPRELAIVRTEAQMMNEPLPLPEGLTEEQVSVVKAARGMPLLLVRDTTGKVARIHVIER